MTRKEREQIEAQHKELCRGFAVMLLLGAITAQFLALYVWMMGRGMDGAFAWQLIATPLWAGLVFFGKEGGGVGDYVWD